MLYWIFCFVGAATLLTYAITLVSQFILGSKEQNLKVKYNAKWAFVTGGSSGIGLEIVRKLASQGINVVVAALDDHLMSKAKESLTLEFEKVEFRFISLDLSRPDCLQVIQEHTKDLDVNLVFNNAGYIKPGLFADLSLDVLLSNFNTNATCTISITHYFLNKMLSNHQKGLIAFTGSSGGFLPGPMSSIYSSTKAWMTNFAVSLAAEVIEDNIDVLVIHPSPIASNFYNNASSMSALQFVKQYAASPTVIASSIFKLAGKATVIDQGAVSVGFKMILKLLDWNLLADIMVAAVRNNGDYKKFKLRKKN